MTQTLLFSASVITALSVLFAATVKVVAWYLRQNRQDTDITLVKRELTVLCQGVLACLDGLSQMGCNSTIAEAKQQLEQHLNHTAHK